MFAAPPLPATEQPAARLRNDDSWRSDMQGTVVVQKLETQEEAMIALQSRVVTVAAEEEATEASRQESIAQGMQAMAIAQASRPAPSARPSCEKSSASSSSSSTSGSSDENSDPETSDDWKQSRRR